jgi:hypothetical protein
MMWAKCFGMLIEGPGEGGAQGRAYRRNRRHRVIARDRETGNPYAEWSAIAEVHANLE